MSDQFAPSQEFASPDTVRKTVDVVRGAQRTVNAQNTPEATELSPAPQPQGPAINGTIGPIANVQPGFATNAAGWLGFAGVAPMGLMFAPVAIGTVPSAIGKAMQWTGNKTGWKGLETFGEKRVAGAETRSNRFEDWSNKQVGKYKAFQRLENSSVLNALGNGTQRVANGFDRITGTSARRTKSIEKQIENGTKRWGTAVEAFETQLGHAEKAGLSNVGDVRTKLGALKNVLTKDSSIDAVNAARLELAKAVDVAHSGAHGRKPMFGEASADSLPTAGWVKRFNRWTGISKPAHMAKDAKGAATNLLSEFEFLNHHAHHAVGLKAKQSFWGGFSDSFKNLGKRVGEMSNAHVAMNAGIGLANLAMNINSLHSFRAQLHQFEAIYEGITGKQCGFWTAMMGDVPPVLKQAQKQLFYGGMREAGINGLITGVDGALFFMKHGYAPMTVVQFAGASFRDGMACEVPLVQVEQAMADAQKRGMKLEPAHYAQLLKLAAPDTIGQVKSTNSMLIKLSNKLASEQWTALKVLQAVNDKTMDRMAADIQKEMAAQGRKPGEEIAPPTPEAPASAMNAAPVAATAPSETKPVSATRSATPNIPMNQIQSLNAVHIPPAGRAAAIV